MFKRRTDCGDRRLAWVGVPLLIGLLIALGVCSWVRAETEGEEDRWTREALIAAFQGLKLVPVKGELMKKPEIAQSRATRLPRVCSASLMHGLKIHQWAPS